MQVKQLSAHSICVTLEEEECSDFAPLGHAQGPPDADTLALYRRLMEQVRRLSGFECRAASVLVEVLEVGTARMRLLITEEVPLEEGEKTHEFLQLCFYRFDDLEALLGCAHALANSAFLYTSLYEQEGHFILCACIPMLPPWKDGCAAHTHARLCEHGQPIAAEEGLSEGYFEEHAQLLIRANALEVLREAFSILPFYGQALLFD